MSAADKYPGLPLPEYEGRALDSSERPPPWRIAHGQQVLQAETRLGGTEWAEGDTIRFREYRNGRRTII